MSALAISVRGPTRSYGPLSAVDGVNLQFSRASCTRWWGNGVEETTLVQRGGSVQGGPQHEAYSRVTEDLSDAHIFCPRRPRHTTGHDDRDGPRNAPVNNASACGDLSEGPLS